MADSIRQQIITALDTRLKTIRTASGYQTDAGAHVFDWEERTLDDSELDAIVYRDRQNAPAAATLSKLLHYTITVEIELKTKAAGNTAARLRKMLADILKAIGTDETFSGLATRTTPGQDEIDIQQDDKIKGQARLTISIEYEATKWGY